MPGSTGLLSAMRREVRLRQDAGSDVACDPGSHLPPSGAGATAESIRVEEETDLVLGRVRQDAWCRIDESAARASHDAAADLAG